DSKLGDGLLIQNCVIAYCKNDGISMTTTGANILFTIRNCVIYENLREGIYTEGGPYGKLINPFVLRNHDRGIYFAAGQNIIQLNSRVADNSLGNYNNNINLANYNEIPVNPTFVSPETCDFRLRRAIPSDPGVFHLGDPGSKNPDGSRSDPGA